MPINDHAETFLDLPVTPYDPEEGLDDPTGHAYRLFGINTVQHESAGHRCFAAERVVSMDAEGTLRRCHFLASPIGNFYDEGFRSALQPRACPAATCGCHIGYVHLERLGLEEVFGEGLLERIPQEPIWVRPT
jgi:hypothetical protein